MSQSGYWAASPWPIEGGANHRPKVTDLPGPNLQLTDHLVATTRHTGRWNVMFAHRDPGQLYLQGTTLAHEPTVAGWVEMVDPKTLEPLSSSGDLPAGGHEWPGGLGVHHNGDLYTVNGSYLHRLDPQCRLVSELPLPVDYAHNGLLILDDGSIVTKDIRVGERAEPSTLTVCDPDLSVLTTVTVPEPSLGRLAAFGDYIYVPGSTRVFRYRWSGSDLALDTDWVPVYRQAGRGGVSGDLGVVGGRVWFMDNADISTVEQRLLTAGPTGAGASGGGTGGRSGGGLPEAGWDEPVRAIGISTSDPTDVTDLTATELPGGWAVAPPLVHDGILVAWDTGGRGIAAFDVGSNEPAPEMLWFQPFRTSMRPLLFADSGELIINDYRLLDDQEASDDLVVLDLETGQMKARVPTGGQEMGGVFLTPGFDRRLYFCSAGTAATVSPG